MARDKSVWKIEDKRARGIFCRPGFKIEFFEKIRVWMLGSPKSEAGERVVKLIAEQDLKLEESVKV